jgi:hypothetical protein
MIYRKNEAFKHCDHYSEWPKVANTVIEADYPAEKIPHCLLPGMRRS